MVEYNWDTKEQHVTIPSFVISLTKYTDCPSYETHKHEWSKFVPMSNHIESITVKLFEKYYLHLANVPTIKEKPISFFVLACL